MEITIIGIDCAVDARKVGLAQGSFCDGQTRIRTVARGKEPLVDQISEWLTREGPVLLALDAPLGWPSPLGEALVGHGAGEPVHGLANQLFRRLTDRFVKDNIGKQSLDVGADRIARTALSALELLCELREKTKRPIHMAWHPLLNAGISAIEVYPAASLIVNDLYRGSYGKAGLLDARREIIRGLGRLIEIPRDRSLMERNTDVLDAAVCVLAAHDFLTGRAMPPSDHGLARKEGWIWVRQPMS